MRSPIPDSTTAALRLPFPAFQRDGGRRPPFLLELLLTWQERARQRYALQQFDDRMLRDIGLSRAEVERECTKPFWRL